MPRFLTSGGLGTMRSFYSTKHLYEPNENYQPNFTQHAPYTYPQAPCHLPTDCETIKPTIDVHTVSFISSVATKLLDLTKAIDLRIDTIKKNCKATTQEQFVFASIDTPNMNISVGAEYVIYVQRFGPPRLGKFDQDKLAEIRAEINAS